MILAPSMISENMRTYFSSIKPTFNWLDYRTSFSRAVSVAEKDFGYKGGALGAHCISVLMYEFTFGWSQGFLDRVNDAGYVLLTSNIRQLRELAMSWLFFVDLDEDDHDPSRDEWVFNAEYVLCKAALCSSERLAELSNALNYIEPLDNQDGDDLSLNILRHMMAHVVECKGDETIIAEAAPLIASLNQACGHAVKLLKDFK